MGDSDIIFQKIRVLVERFKRDKSYYCSVSYNEASVRKEFINPFFKALGWDVENKQGLPPVMREVMVEEGETSGAPDYAFRLNGQTKFFVEAKKPSESLDNVKHILQAKSYAWNSKTVFISALTDFEETKLYDASLKPDPKAPERGLVWSLKFTEYLDNLDKLKELSKEKVLEGSLERLLLRDKESKRLRVPVDEAFLEQLTVWREELAKSYKKHTPDLNVYTLNEIVQRLLDRLVFVRICEDRRIVPARSMEELARYWREEGLRRDLMTDHLAPFFHKLNERFNGEILQPHPCEIYKLDSGLLAGIIESLYFPSSPYQFNIIGVEILGTIYERYLGKTLHVTPKRVSLEDKPEVRKAGGVYYTPSYIVQYIVKNTLGKMLEKPGLTSDDVSKLRILDPACGSGSFLLEAYDKLLEWHLEYYSRQAKAGKQSRMIGAADLPYFTDVDGELELTATEKARILQNNIYGVDIDPQAVEVAMMSLYIKLLEGEVHFPSHRQILPHLKRNIRCGNSLIGPDFYEHQGELFDDEATRRINAFDWTSKEHGFGEIMAQGGFDAVIGNPPYNAALKLEEESYLQKKYESVRQGRQDTAAIFVEAGLGKTHNALMYLLPNRLLSRKRNHGPFQCWLHDKTHIQEIVYLGKIPEIKANDEFMIGRFSKPTAKSNTQMKICERANKSDFEMNSLKFTKIPQAMWGPPDYNMNIRQTSFDTGILSKMKSTSTPLGEIAETKDGMVPFIRDKLLSEVPKDERYKPLLGVKGYYKLEKYFYDWCKLYICYDIEEAKKFIKDKKELRKVQLRDEAIFLKPEKIITAQDSISIKGTLDVSQFYVTNSIHSTYLKGSTKGYNIRYLLGLMNSILLNYYHQSLVLKGQDIHPQILVTNIPKLPIRTIDFNDKNDKEMHDRMVELVEVMLKLNKELHEKKLSDRDREALERRIDYTDREIDKLVYKLYGLTEDEIKIVEG